MSTFSIAVASIAIGAVFGAAARRAFKFIHIMWQYRIHGASYAAKAAWRIAIQGIPF